MTLSCRRTFILYVLLSTSANCTVTTIYLTREDVSLSGKLEARDRCCCFYTKRRLRRAKDALLIQKIACINFYGQHQKFKQRFSIKHNRLAENPQTQGSLKPRDFVETQSHAKVINAKITLLRTSRIKKSPLISK